MEIEEKENLTDPLDVASRVSEQINNEAIEAQRYRCRPEQVQNPDGSWPVTECADCGDDLGHRMAMGKVRCVPCQEVLEKLRTRYV